MRLNGLAIWLFCLALTNCSAVNNTFSGDGAGGINKAQPDVDNDRPSEDGEGIPGYLVDPEYIRFIEDDDDIIIKADQGSFVDNDGKPVKVGVNVITASTRPNVVTNKQDALIVEGRQEKYRQTEPDGSFSTKIKNTERLIFLQLGDPTKTLRIPTQPNGKHYVVARSLNDGRTATAVDPDRGRRYLDLVDFEIEKSGSSDLKKKDNTDTIVNNDDETGDAIEGEAPSPPQPDYLTMTECNSAGYYWNVGSASCNTIRELANISNCKENGINNIENDLQDADLDDLANEIDNAESDDFEMFQCSFTDPGKTQIELEMYNEEDNVYRSVIVPSSAFF